MDYEAFWKALLDYGVLEKSEMKTWMRHMESVWRIHGGSFFPRGSEGTAK